jgi:hypothetical protein
MGFPAGASGHYEAQGVRLRFGRSDREVKTRILNGGNCATEGGCSAPVKLPLVVRIALGRCGGPQSPKTSRLIFEVDVGLITIFPGPGPQVSSSRD